MIKGGKQEWRTLSECQKLLGSQQTSGLSIKEYCRVKNVARSSFYKAKDRVLAADKIGAINVLSTDSASIAVLEEVLEMVTRCSSIENARLTIELAIANQRLSEITQDG